MTNQQTTRMAPPRRLGAGQRALINLLIKHTIKSSGAASGQSQFKLLAGLSSRVRQGASPESGPDSAIHFKRHTSQTGVISIRSSETGPVSTIHPFVYLSPPPSTGSR